jgi:hypothetical protein
MNAMIGLGFINRYDLKMVTGGRTKYNPAMEGREQYSKSVTSSFDFSLLTVSSVCHDLYHDHGLLVPFHVICCVDALMQREKVIYCAPFLSSKLQNYLKELNGNKL